MKIGVRRLGLVVALSIASVALPAHADDEPPFKLTLGAYRFSTAGWGMDTNLRAAGDWGNAWIGHFRASALDVAQTRLGWDHSFGSVVRVQPSLQYASGGFWGGSVNVEAGQTWVLGAGLGRTNLHPYYNLNFDPNDAWSLLAAWRGEHGRSLTASFIRDNRQNPDQRHFHLTWRQPLAEGNRLTLDALLKRGRVDGQMVTRAGFTVTHDWPRWFVRLAYDPKTNFTADDQWRLSVGTRF
jgi:hypothetical protein